MAGPQPKRNPFFFTWNGRAFWKDKSSYLAFDASATAATPATPCFFCVPRERLCIWISVSSARLLPGGHVRIYSCLYFRAMNTRLIRLLYVEVCFHFLFSGRDWTRVILVDLGVVSSNPNRSGTKGGHTQGLDATVSRLSSFPRYPDTLITRCYDTRSPPPPSKCVKIIVKVHGCLTRWWLKPFITFFISYFILLF